MFETRRTVEWGECDALGIAFYPSFFRWMDASYHAFTRSEGFDQAMLPNAYGIAGTPLVDARCAFLSPCRFYEVLMIETEVERLGTSSLELVYRFTIADRQIATGRETRAFVAERVEDGVVRLAKASIPAALRTRLERHLA